MRYARLAAATGLLAWACGGKTTGDGGAGGGSGTGSASTGSVGSGSVGTGSATVGSGSVGSGPGVAVGAGGSIGGEITIGAGGGPGSGGSTGAGGDGVTYCDPPYPPPVRPTSTIISNFEAGPIVQAVPQGGVWAPDSDGTGIGSLTIEPCGTDGLGLHFKGQGHTAWGADVAAPIATVTQPVDVSAFRGIDFLIRSNFPTQAIVKIQNPYSQPPCGKCDDLVVGAECYSGYIKFLGVSGARQFLAWSDFSQQAWGYHAPGTAQFDPRNLVSIAFAFDKGVDFDVCIDDIVLVP